ncbi:hypothetical protein [Micromonospora sp. NBC_00421]|uniref:hypothetical protein n=1 Tax=Micromonospora sp. NBC_00421 TaxID=2975976 RepID=UPI002E23D625
MQTLAPPAGGPDNPAGHTADEVRAALVGRTGARRFTFRYALLSATNQYLYDLDDVTSCTVQQDWLADIKRTATLQIRDTGSINYLSDRIQPWVRLHLPPYGPDDWVQWPQGVFILSTPTRTHNKAGQVLRDVDAYDLAQVLADDAVTSRYTVAANANYISVASVLLGVGSKVVIPSSPTAPVGKEWEPGTSKLQIINDLLAAVNYNSVSYDESGTAVVRPYTAPDQRPDEWTYADDQDSVILPEVDQTYDLVGVPNRWTMVVSDPDRVALTSTYTNSNPASPTSTVRRGRVIVDFESGVDAADQATLDALVARKAFEASQVYEQIEFSTGLMPIHSGNDVYRIGFGRLALGASYAETSWQMPLKAGAQMRHTARRVVPV